MVEYNNTIKTKAEFLAKKNPKYIPQIFLLKTHVQTAICKDAVRYLSGKLESLIDTSSLDMGILRNSQFASNFDKNPNIKEIRCGDIHNFMNLLRNRGTGIEAPTAGKSYTFGLGDMNEISKGHADHILKYAETELRIRAETDQIKKQLLELQLENKTNSEKSTKKSLEILKLNYDGLCNSKLSLQGNKLIYSLDGSFRELNEIKNTMKNLYKQTKEFILKDFKEDLETKDRIIEDLKQNYKLFQNELTQNVKCSLTEKKEEMLVEITTGISKRKALDFKSFISSDKASTKEMEASELRRLQNDLLQIRIINKWILHRIKEKNKAKIDELKAQLVSNQYLWEQINESERREALLKQELSFTQQNLATAEKLADYLQSQIEDMNNQRLRLQQFKTTKGRRIIELESKIKKQQSAEREDNQLMLRGLFYQDKQIKSAQISERQGAMEFIDKSRDYLAVIKDLEHKIKRERQLKLDGFKEVSMIREDVNMVASKDKEQI